MIDQNNRSQQTYEPNSSRTNFSPPRLFDALLVYFPGQIHGPWTRPGTGAQEGAARPDRVQPSCCFSFLAQQLSLLFMQRSVLFAFNLPTVNLNA